MALKEPPPYVAGHNLLAGKSVLITAAAGAGIGFAAATRAAEEGARAVMISDIHEGRLAKAVDQLKADTGLAAANWPTLLWKRTYRRWSMRPKPPWVASMC